MLLAEMVITNILVSSVFIGLSVNEAICSYRNPYPLFTDNSDKKFNELLKDKNKQYKTRSILEDLGGYTNGRINWIILEFKYTK